MSRKGNLTRLQWIVDHANYTGDGCLFWPFGKDDKGYGVVPLGNGRGSGKAHREMCKLVRGPAPVGKPQASHLCGNGHLACVHPKHLAWKSNSENQRDRRRHGTHYGAKGSRTKLSAETIAEIRRLRGVETQKSLADRFGVKYGCIQYWQGHDRVPKPPGQSRQALARRARRAA